MYVQGVFCITDMLVSNVLKYCKYESRHQLIAVTVSHSELK
jgi:hypothetical protein